MIIRIAHISPPLCCNALHGSPHEGVGLQHRVEMVHRQREQIAVCLRPDTVTGIVWQMNSNSCYVIRSAAHLATLLALVSRHISPK